MTAGAKWIAIVVCLLAGNVLAGVVLIGASHHGGSRVIDGYYEQAVHYDDAIDQATNDRRLGWRVGVALAGGEATVTALDAAGQPLAGARVRLAGIERKASAGVLTGELVATRAGEYRGHVGGAGWVDLAVTIERGRDRYVHRFALEAK